MFAPGAFTSSFRQLRARLCRDGRRGSAAIEFAMVAPVFFLFLFGLIETGVVYFAQSTLTNSVEDAARLVRTGQRKGVLTPDTVKGDICNKFASSPDGTPAGDAHTGMVSYETCMKTVQVDMRVFDGFGGAAAPSVINPDGSLNVNNMTIQETDACKVVLFRAYYPWTVLTPYLASLMSNMPSGNQILLGTTAAFRTEPFPEADRDATNLC